MTTPATSPATSRWARIAAAVRFVLDLEPVTVQAIIRAVLVLAAAVGIAIPEGVEPRSAGAVVAFYALVELLTTLRARAKSTPSAVVVESVQPSTGTVVAGPASELVTGTEIRQLGSINPNAPNLFPQA